MATNPKPSAEGVWISAEAIQAARELSASPCRCTAVSGPCARHQRYARAFDAYAAARVAEAVAAEREECAVLVEDTDVETLGRGYMQGDDARGTLYAAARAIRARAKGGGNGSV